MKKLAALLALALASVALVACGGSSDNSSSSGGGEAAGGAAAGGAAKEGGKQAGGVAAEGGEKSGGGSTLDIEADPGGELAYTSEEATAKAGKVTVDFNNPQGLTHDVAIEDEKGETIGQTDLVAGEETSTTVNLKPGTYHYYCTVPGHREAGMEGTLTVK